MSEGRTVINASFSRSKMLRSLLSRKGGVFAISNTRRKPAAKGKGPDQKAGVVV